jgi:hypothetical protein
MTAPTKMALVPVEPGDDVVKQVVIAMGQALASPARIKDGPINMIESNRHVAQAGADALISASPSSGRLPAADLERAIGEAAKEIVRTFGAPTMVTAEKAVRAAFAAIGLPVEGEQG